MMEHNQASETTRIPSCPRDGEKFIQIIDWSLPLIQEAMERARADAALFEMIDPEVLYVCHGCDKIFTHPVPPTWVPDPGWLPETW